MNSIKCIIIDDEQHAIDVLEHYILKQHDLQLVGTFTNPLEGLKSVKKLQADLVFLDIQMDEMSGLEIASLLQDNVKIIFSTAFPQYAVEGFELDAVDYLVKPVSFERFYKAIEKVRKSQTNLSSDKNLPNYLLVKTEQKGKLIKINFGEIDYIESLGNYVTFHCADRNITAYATLRDLENYLPKHLFIRIHKSHIVQLAKICAIENGFVQINTLSGFLKLSIGNTYKEELKQKLNLFQ